MPAVAPAHTRRWWRCVLDRAPPRMPDLAALPCLLRTLSPRRWSRRVLDKALPCMPDLAALSCLLHTPCPRRWSRRVLDEFFAQGDLERARGLAVSPMMDRGATNLALSQINFIEFVVAPLYYQVISVCSASHVLACRASCACRWGRLYLAWQSAASLDDV